MPSRCPMQVLMLMLGRLIALTAAEEELCRLVLPLLTDTLAAQSEEANAEVGGGAGGHRWFFLLFEPEQLFIDIHSGCMLWQGSCTALQGSRDACAAFLVYPRRMHGPLPPLFAPKKSMWPIFLRMCAAGVCCGGARACLHSGGVRTGAAGRRPLPTFYFILFYF